MYVTCRPSQAKSLWHFAGVASHVLFLFISFVFRVFFSNRQIFRRTTPKTFLKSTVCISLDSQRFAAAVADRYSTVVPMGDVSTSGSPCLRKP